VGTTRVVGAGELRQGGEVGSESASFFALAASRRSTVTKFARGAKNVTHGGADEPSVTKFAPQTEVRNDHPPQRA
jgi:hypothetical protein